MKKITTLFLGFLIFSCGAVEDDIDETVNTPEPTPVTFGEWTPAFSDQREDFTQTRTGSDGSNQTRTITVSSSIVGTEDVYEMEDNQDYNNDGDMFDVAEIVQTRYLTSPNVGAIVYVDIQVVHNNNGTNQIVYNGQSYPINFFDIYGPYGDDDNEFSLTFQFLESYVSYKPDFTNDMYWELVSSDNNELVKGKYKFRYSEDSTIPSQYGYEQSTDDKYIFGQQGFGLNYFIGEYIPESIPSQEFYLKVNSKIHICNGVPIGYDSDGCDSSPSVLSAVLYYKEINGNSFFSIRGDDSEQRPYEVFFFGNNQVYWNGDLVNPYNIDRPSYQLERPYTTSSGPWADDSPRQTSGLNNNNGIYFPDDNFPDIQIGTIYQVITQSLKVVDKSTGPIPDSWREYFNQTYGYSPENLNLVRLKLLNLESDDDPVVEAFYKDNAELIFLRIGTNNSNAAQGFHMKLQDYDFTELVSQQYRECNGNECYFNDVSKTLNFYLDRYLRDLRSDAILIFQ